MKISIAIALAMSAGTALAADLPSSMKDSYAPAASQAHNWTGVYVGGQLGYSIGGHKFEANGVTQQDLCTVSSANQSMTMSDVSETTCATGGKLVNPEYSQPITGYSYLPEGSIISAALDGIHGDGLFAGVNAGADIAKGNLLFGVFGNYNFGGADSSASLSLNNVELASAKIEEGNSWVAGARVGYLFGNDKSSLLYVLGGYSQKDMKYSYVTANDEGSKTLTFSGFVAGAGAEYALNKWASIGIEYQHFFGGKETLIDEDGLKVTDDYSDDKVMATLKLKLTGSAFGY